MSRQGNQPEQGVLSAREKSALRLLHRELVRWKALLRLDPLWDLDAMVVEDDQIGGRTAGVDIGTSEYYFARLYIARSVLSLRGEVLADTIRHVACHELMHLVSCDYQRAVHTAVGKNVKLDEEIEYRYEQFVSRLEHVLLAMDTGRRGRGK